MFRLPGADRTPDKAAIEEERRRAKQNVWFTMKAFVAYVVVLRLGKVFTSRLLHRLEACVLNPENGHKCSWLFAKVDCILLQSLK